MRIFISHTSKDKEFAKKLASDLKASDLDVFTYFDAIMPGDSITEKIGSAILNSDAIVLLLSHQSAKSPWVSSEIALAKAAQSKAKQPRILPVVIEQHSDIPFFIKDLLYLDLSDDQKYKENLPMLIKSLSRSDVPDRDLKKEQQTKEQMFRAQETALILEKEFYEHKRAAKNRSVAWLTGIVSIFSLLAAIIALFLNYIANVNWTTLIASVSTFFIGIFVSIFFYRKLMKYEIERMIDRRKEFESFLHQVMKEREESK